MWQECPVQEDQKVSLSSTKWCGLEQMAVRSHEPLSGANYNIISSALGSYI